MSATDHLAAENHGLSNGKRRHSTGEHSERVCKVRRVHQHQLNCSSSSWDETRLQDWQNKAPQQLPSPFSTKHQSFEGHTASLDNPVANQKRRAESSCLDGRATKRSRLLEADKDTSSVDQWLSKLPGHLEGMSQPPSKRSRSSDSLGRIPSQPGDETETTVSRDAKYSAYKDVNYVVVLETKNSFMRISAAGLIEEDLKLCERLLSENQPIPQNTMFEDDRFEEFCSHLQDRSEARVYLDLHPLLVPSAENLFIRGQRTLQYLIEGYNDRWVKAIPFYGPRPQPDHTVGFKWSAFTELQRRKLGIEPTSKSFYTAREDIYFPFLMSEVKCGKQALDLADRANAHSMTIAVRGVVELFRKAACPMDIHRKVLAFSVSHDHTIVRLYAHYAEIDGGKTSYYRHKIKQFDYSDGRGVEKWTSYTFARNVYGVYAPMYLELIKKMIDQLPDPVEESFESAIAADGENALSSQEGASSATESQEGEFRRPRQARGLNAELRTIIQSLQQQLEHQRKDSGKERETIEQREATLMSQLEQQRKESEQQRKDLMQLMKEQSEQLREQATQIRELLKAR